MSGVYLIRRPTEPGNARIGSPEFLAAALASFRFLRYTRPFRPLSMKLVSSDIV